MSDSTTTTTTDTTSSTSDSDNTALQQISGLISGLDTDSIIEALLTYDTNKITLVENQVTELEAEEECYSTISELLSTLGDTVSDLADSDLWDSTTSTSSDESSLTATTDSEAAVGTYTFQVLQLAQAAAYTSSGGYSDSDSTAVGAGTISIDSAECAVSEDVELTSLNGGEGVDLGTIKITTMDGDSATIDLSSAVTLQDVLDAINACGLDVEATMVDGGLVVTDTSGGTSSKLKIQNGSGCSTATDLGILGTSTTGSITGSNIYGLSTTTLLSSLHDGLGLGSGTLGSIAIIDGTNTYTIDLSECTTVADLEDAIYEGTSGAVSLSISDNGMGFTVTATDSSADLSILNVGSTTCTADYLGISVLSGGATISGADVIADAGSVQISSLSGINATGINGATGSGAAATDLGSFTATVGSTTVTFDLTSLSGANSLQDVIDLMNEQAETQLGDSGLLFSVNDTGNGIQVTNTTGSSVSFTDGTGTTATDLGLTSASVSNGDVLDGGDLDKKYISGATTLAELNGGEGVAEGSIKITDADGDTATVDLSECTTVEEVLYAINNCGLDITASVNDTGDGLVIAESSSSTGTGNISVKEVDGGSTAADLNILGTGADDASGLSTIDGSFEVNVTIDSDDTLTDVLNKVAAATDKVEVSIINDGSSYRLTITAADTGAANNFLLSSTLEDLSFSRSATGQDSIMLYGGTDSGSTAVVLKSSTNTNSSAIDGLTLNLLGVSDGTVSITVAQDTEGISDAVQAFVDAYNALKDMVDTLTTYVSDDDDSSDDEDDSDIEGLLWGNSNVNQLMQEVTDLLEATSETSGDIMSIFDIGVSYDTDSDSDTYNQLIFDTDTFDELLTTNFEDLQSFFCKSENVASSVENTDATVTGADAASGYSLENLINGSTSGYQAAGTIEDGYDTITVNFGEAYTLDYITIKQINTEDMSVEDYGLSDFNVYYLDSETGSWTLLREVTDNTSSSTTIGTSDTITTTAIRIVASGTNASDGIMRLGSIKVMSETGVANSWESVTDELTDTTDGWYATIYDSTETKIDSLEETIEDLEDRLAAKQAMLETKYAYMETSLATIQAQGESVVESLEALTSDD